MIIEFSPEDYLRLFSQRLKTKLKEKGVDPTQAISKTGALPRAVSSTIDTTTVGAVHT